MKKHYHYVYLLKSTIEVSRIYSQKNRLAVMQPNLMNVFWEEIKSGLD